jgi:hypothetical protein
VIAWKVIAAAFNGKPIPLLLLITNYAVRNERLRCVYSSIRKISYMHNINIHKMKI